MKVKELIMYLKELNPENIVVTQEDLTRPKETIYLQINKIITDRIPGLTVLTYKQK